jgi:hypothetical protein
MSDFASTCWEQYRGEAHTLREWLQRIPLDPEPLLFGECAPLLIGTDYLKGAAIDRQPTCMSKAKHPGGRPSRYSRELAVDICCRFANTGGAWLNALDAYGVDKTTALRWRNKHMEFRMMLRLTQALLKYYPDSFPSRRYRRRAVLSPKYAHNSNPRRKIPRHGRPSTYHPGFVYKVWPTQRQTARAIGVSKATVAKWCKRYQDFGDIQKACWLLKCRI